MRACLSPNGGVESRADGPVLTLLVGTIQGLYALVRPSASEPWQVERRGVPDKHISSLVYDEPSNQLFAGFHGRGEEGGLYASADEGWTWTPRMQGLKRPHVYGLTAERRGDQTILYAGVEPPALYRSLDLGRTWSELPNLGRVPGTDKWTFPPPPHIAHVKNIAIHPTQPGVFFALVEQGAVLKTEDDGETWRELDAYASDQDSFYHDVHRLVISRSDPSRMHLATGDGLYYSQDAGKTWAHQQSRGDRVGYPDALFLDPRDEDTVYLGGAGDAPETWRAAGGAHPGFIVSHDAGKTWSERMNGLPAPIRGNIEAMAMHSWPEGLAFYAGTAVGDVFGSEDGGQSWTLIASGLPPVSKARHYRHFLSADEKFQLEEKGRAERRAEGLDDKEYQTHA